MDTHRPEQDEPPQTLGLGAGEDLARKMMEKYGWQEGQGKYLHSNLCSLFFSKNAKMIWQVWDVVRTVSKKPWKYRRQEKEVELSSTLCQCQSLHHHHHPPWLQLLLWFSWLTWWAREKSMIRYKKKLLMNVRNMEKWNAAWYLRWALNMHAPCTVVDD